MLTDEYIGNSSRLPLMKMIDRNAKMLGFVMQLFELNQSSAEQSLIVHLARVA